MNSAGTLYIGNRSYSSWSLRAWLLLRHFQVPFEARRLALLTEAFRAAVVSRFRTYGVDAGPANASMATVLDQPAMREWCAEAADEPEALPSMEVGA